MADIKIRVEGRRATNLTPEVKLVTWNEGYEAEFEFDESWSASELKTALFITKGQTIRKPFTGNKCEVPMLVGVEILRVGVESNDILGLKTTLAAVVECEFSARDLSGEEIEAPTPSVYDEIIELINSGMLKGDKGDAGSIAFKPVIALPTENIDNSVIYLVPIEGNDENSFAEYVYIDGKWEVLGSVALNVDLSEYVKFADFDHQTIESLTENSQEMTDTQKASACEWLGAVPQTKINNDMYVVYGRASSYGNYAPQEYTFSYTPSHGSFVRWGDPNTLGATEVTPYGALYAPTPLQPFQAANKKYVDDNFLRTNKTTGNKVYVSQSQSDGSIKQTMVTFSSSVVSGAIVARNSSGAILANVPTEDNHVSNKKYVDDAIAGLSVEGGGGTKFYKHIYITNFATKVAIATTRATAYTTANEILADWNNCKILGSLDETVGGGRAQDLFVDGNTVYFPYKDSVGLGLDMDKATLESIEEL